MPDPSAWPQPAPLRVLDLFCGAAGGWSFGLHRTGAFRTVAACEIDPWRRERFAANNPGVRLYDDVRTLTAGRLATDGAFPDIIVGSPPCQDASAANPNGRGIDGERTGLFREFIRLVDQCRPRWAAAENVPGLRNRGADRVIADLEAIGYTVWPLVVGARHVGAPHKRDRVWFVAHANERRHGSGEAWRLWAGRLGLGAAEGGGTAPNADENRKLEQGGSEREQRGRHSHPGEGPWAAPDADQARLAQREGEPGDDGAECAASERDGFFARFRHWNGGAPRSRGMDDGLPRGMARNAVAAFGDAVVPTIPELIGRAILATEAAVSE